MRINKIQRTFFILFYFRKTRKSISTWKGDSYVHCSTFCGNVFFSLGSVQHQNTNISCLSNDVAYEY